MLESYLTLPQKEQALILSNASTNQNINRDAILLEKDIWICWTLEQLFKMPNRLPMAFKGGTSLSKAFQVIDIFSEDIDITIDHQAFNCGDPFANGISKTKLKNMSLQIKTLVTEHIKESVIPYYEKIIAEQFRDNLPKVELDNDGETLHLHYPSILENKSGYVIDSIKIEFGGRNLTIPNDILTIKSDISEYVSNVLFPSAEVVVLSPEKTFWEKLTLIHYECNRPTLKDDANRISRHWYDIAKLANSEIGKKAISNYELLKEVVKIKKTFYDSGYAKYDDCLIGRFRLIPDKCYIQLLKDDFNNMLENKMFYAVQPDFSEIIKQISDLETQVNDEIVFLNKY